MLKFFISLAAVLLFLVEPVFSLFSPFELGEHVVYIVPRFLILYFIFLAIYYQRKYVVVAGFIFGLLYDVFYIDMIGLYMVLYPLIGLVASSIVKIIQKHLLVSVFIALFLLAGLEFIVYQFNYLIGYTNVEIMEFIMYRLSPTLLANLLFVALLVWIFSYLMNGRVFSEDT